MSQMTTAELIKALDWLRATMISVATAGPRIQQVQLEFQENYDLVVSELTRRQMPNPLPYRDLWQWHGRRSSGDLPTYASPRDWLHFTVSRHRLCAGICQADENGRYVSNLAGDKAAVPEGATDASLTPYH